MDRFKRVFRLHSVLSKARLPVPRRTLEEKLECSTATIKRIIMDMRDSFGAPVEYDRERNGYYYRRPQEGEPPYELPGLWFQPEELHALLTAQHMLSRLQPGLIGDLLAPLGKRIQYILEVGSGRTDTPGKRRRGERDGVPRTDQLMQRVRVLPTGARQVKTGIFTTVADALLDRARLRIDYAGRARGEATRREISPQRLVHYRQNWYLDAWCHGAEDLRIFSLDRIGSAERLNDSAREVDGAEIDRRVAGSYGIFGGEATETAVVRFDPNAARWVADEQWHPEQQGEWLADGRFELRLPYGNPTELVRDLMRWMPECEVLEPASLRKRVTEALRTGVARHGGRGRAGGPSRPRRQRQDPASGPV